MSLKRVLVFGNGLLLGAGIVNLLSRESDLEIVEISSHDTAALTRQVEVFQPAVVVLDELTYLADRTKLLAFFENYSEIQLIMVSADRNLIRIYQGQQVAITQAADFIDIVRDTRSRQ